MVTGTWARGHWRRGPGGGDSMVTPLTPDEIGNADFDDLGLIDIPDIPDPDAACLLYTSPSPRDS